MASQAEIDLIVNATNTLADLQRDIARIAARAEASAPTINIPVDVDRDGALRRVTSSLGPALGMLSSLGGSLLKVGLSAGTAAPLVGGLAAAVAQIGPAAAVATQGMLAMQLVSGTLKLGMLGVQEAISTAFDPEATPEELAEAMEKLAPEARKFVLELRSMRGGFKELQLDVQNRLFADLAGGLRPLAENVLPSVSDALGRTADSLNEMAKGVGLAAIEMGANGTLDKALQGATKGLENLEKVPGRVTTGFGQLAAAAAPAFDRITAAADRASADIADKLTAAFDSGALETAIDEAIDLIKQLGESGGDILGGLRNIFGGLTTDGRDLFTILNELTGAFEELTASEAFQTILNELAMTADTLVKNVLPLLLEAFEQLGPVIEELGPPIRDLLNELGESLMPVIEQLGPILQDLAIIIKEQMPGSINVLKITLGALVVALSGVHTILKEAVIPILSQVADVMNNRFVKAVANAAQDIPGAVDRILHKFVELRTSATEQLRVIGDNLSVLAANVRERLAGSIRHTLQTVVGYFSALPGRIQGALGDLGGLLVGAGESLVQGLINGITSKVGSLISTLGSITDKIPDWKGPADRDIKLLTPSGELIMDGLMAGIQEQVPALTAQLQAITLGIPTTVNQGVSPIGQHFNTAAPGLPAIYVSIGNEPFTGLIRAEVVKNDQETARRNAQGVRR